MREVETQTADDAGPLRQVAGTIREGSEWKYTLVWPRHWKGSRWRVMALATQYPYPFEQVIIRSLLPPESGIWLVMTSSQLIACWAPVGAEVTEAEAVAPAPITAREFDPKASGREVGE